MPKLSTKAAWSASPSWRWQTQPAQPALDNLSMTGSLTPRAGDQAPGQVVGHVDISTEGAHDWSGSNFWHVAWNISLSLPVVLDK